MMKRVILVTIMTAVSLFSCQKQESDVIENNSESLILSNPIQSTIPPANRIEEVGDCGCVDGCIKKKLIAIQYPNYMHYVNNVILDNHYYSLRDEFLSRSQLGNQYIRIYYSVDSYFMETLDLELIGKILSTLPLINEAITNLLDSSFQGVIMDKNLETKVTDVITTSISKSSSQEYRDILSTLQRDVNSIANLNKSAVYRFFDMN